ncbi:hypothetical protein BDR04DRAFT_1025887, partial [Suillus decipiens]
ILPALSLDCILHLDALDHSYTTATFNEFIDSLLDNMNPFPQENTVIVMDNARIHKSPHLKEMVQELTELSCKTEGSWVLITCSYLFLTIMSD